MQQEFAYPKNRPSYFGFKVIRLMAKVRAADQIGTSGLAMVSVIAMQEDACGYKRAVSFWNEPLMLDLGLKARNTFNRTREACVEAGWLKYKSGGTRKVGYYYVSIPDEFLDEKDSAVDERLSSNFERNEELMMDQSGTNEGLMRDQCGSNEELMWDQCDTVSTLYPIPIPNPTPSPSKDAPKPPVSKSKYSEDEQFFWKYASHVARVEDTKCKAQILKKYRARRKDGFTQEQMLAFVDLHTEHSKSNWDRRFGLRSQLEKPNLEQILHGQVKRDKTLLERNTENALRYLNREEEIQLPF